MIDDPNEAAREKVQRCGQYTKEPPACFDTRTGVEIAFMMQ
jgi:hypothetical protein